MAIAGVLVRVAFGWLPGDGEPDPGDWVDISDYVMSVDTTFGRSQDLDRIEAATANILLENTDARFTPENATGTYYPDVIPFVPIEVKWDVASAPSFVLGTSVLGTATLYETPPTTSNIFRGLVMVWDPDWYTSAGGTVMVQAADILRFFKETELTAVAFSQQTVGARITAVLSAISNPFPTSIDSTGVTIAADAAFTGNALEYLIQLADLDGGLFYPRQDGQLVFTSRATLEASEVYQEVQAAIGDLAPEIPYRELDLALDEQIHKNRIIGKNSAGVSITAQEDAEAQSYYLTRTQDLGTTAIVSVAETQLRARQQLVARSAGRLARVRVDALQFDLYNTDVDASTVMTLDLYHRVSLARRPSAGSSLSMHALVQGVEHHIATGNNWTVVIKVSWIPTPFILGSAILGACLGGSALG